MDNLIRPEDQKRALELVRELIKILLKEAHRNGGAARQHVRLRTAKLVTDVLEEEGVL